MAIAIIPAAGSGKRLDKGFNKAFIPLAGIPMLRRTVEALARCPEIDQLIIVVAAGEEAQVRDCSTEAKLAKPWQVVTGGTERQYSIANALRFCQPGLKLLWFTTGRGR